ncbi:MAG: HAMP domain-containing protein, partial [Trebonia sp.]
MAGQDVLSSHPEERLSLPARLRRLSDRTPLRTKLITAVLALVIMALAAISVASTYTIRNYVTTQHDGDLHAAMNYVSATGNLPRHISLGTATPTQSNIIEGVQRPGQQLTWETSNSLPGTGSTDPLPRLPTNGLWPGETPASTSGTFSAPAQAGTHTWRVLAQTVNVGVSPDQTTTAILIVAEDIGNVNALTWRLVLFDLVVGAAIVLVLAAVGAAIVRANLRSLDDIELTAGQIAAGHLDHRVPEGDPRTEIGSLSRSLNAMLSQVERAFHAQEEAEQSAHQSEERMRRFIADAAHELRTPLTTIRGFAAHYRQRGGASRLRPEPPAPEARANGSTEVDEPRPVAGEGQSLALATDSASSGPVNGATDGRGTQEGLSPAELDHLMG